MTQYFIEPVILETGDAEIFYPPDKVTQIEMNKTKNFAMLISESPSKPYSFCVKISKQVVNNTLRDKIIIKIDKSVVGPLVSGDKVVLRDYKPAIATQVIIGISTKYYVPEGDWGRRIINPAVHKLMLEMGNQIEFMYGKQHPMLIKALVIATIPKTPVIIDEQTIFTVEKIDQTQITAIHNNSNDMKKKRAEIYISQVENQIFDFITAIRSKKTDEYSKTFNFSNVYPKEIYNAIKHSLKSFKFVIDEISEYSDVFSSNLVAIPKGKHSPNYLLEYQVSGRNSQGRIGFWIYTLKKGEARIISRKWDKVIINLTQSMKEIPRAIPNMCQACGAELQIENQNQKGIIQCINCKIYNQLPMSLRTY